jgi:hypothetical protein
MTGDTLIKAAGLWRKTSGRTGREYLAGRLGVLRVLVFENKDADQEGEPTHLLMISAAEDKSQEQSQRLPTRGQRTWDRSRDVGRHITRNRAQAAGEAILAERDRQRDGPPVDWLDDSAEAIRDLTEGPGR